MRWLTLLVAQPILPPQPPPNPPHFKGGLGTVCSSTAHVDGESFPSCVGKLPSRLLSLSTLQDVGDGVVMDVGEYSGIWRARHWGRAVYAGGVRGRGM